MQTIKRSLKIGIFHYLTFTKKIRENFRVFIIVSFSFQCKFRSSKSLYAIFGLDLVIFISFLIFLYKIWSNFLASPKNIRYCLQLVSIYSHMKSDTFPSQPLRKWKSKKVVLFSCQRSVQNMRINTLFCIETLLPRHINSNMWFIAMRGCRYVRCFQLFLLDETIWACNHRNLALTYL